MKRLSITQLIPGMIVAEDVYNLDHELLIPKGTVLTDKLITKLDLYGILTIFAEDVLPASDLSETESSYYERIKSSPEFHLFKEDFENEVELFRENMNLVVEKNKALDVKTLLKNTLSIVSNHSGSISILDMLQNMREYDDSTYTHSLNVALICNVIGNWLRMNEKDLKVLVTCGLLHDIGKSIDHEVEGSHIQIGVDLCRKYKESPTVINAVEAHHGDVEPETLIACVVQAADTISAARPGARRETLETYTNRLKQLEDITNQFKGVDKSFAIQAGREIRIMVVPEQVSDADMVLLARDIAKQIEFELEYPGQIKVNVIRESRVTDYAK